MENFGFLFAAFGLIWAVLFVYVLMLVHRQQQTKAEITALREELKQARKIA